MGAATIADALPFVHIGVAPLPWDAQEFSQEELANRFAVATLRPEDEESQTVAEDAAAVETDPGHTVTALLLIRRFVRESEIGVDGSGADIYNYLWDHASHLAKQIYTVSNTFSATNTLRCPRVRQVRRLGFGFNRYSSQVADGASFTADFQIVMGDLED